MTYLAAYLLLGVLTGIKYMPECPRHLASHEVAWMAPAWLAVWWLMVIVHGGVWLAGRNKWQ